MTIQTILVATDGSANGSAAVAAAGTLAKQCDARVLAVHVFEPLALLGHVPPPVDFAAHARHAEELLASDWTASLTKLGVEFDSEVVEGKPSDAIVAAAIDAKADLIVVGARGLSPLERLLVGSTTQALLEEAPCPVVVVPARS